MDDNNGILIHNARFDGYGAVDISIRNGKIAEIGKISTADHGLVINAVGLVAMAGLIDIHTHGGNGIDIVCCSDEELDELTMFYASNGVTSFLATIGTTDETSMEEAVKKVARLTAKGAKGAKPIGIHLEGPCLSKDYCGAQPVEYLRNPDMKSFDKLYNIAPHLLKLVTIAPELDGAIAFIQYIASKGVAVSIGHTGATCDTCLDAISAGVKSVTHTLNGMRSFHRHEPSVLGAAVLSDVYCEIICDGRHLHPRTVEFLMRAKGCEKLIIVTDSIMAAGLADGIYEGFITVVVENGDARLLTGSRAGSTLKANEGVGNFVKFTGADVNTAVSLMTINPARLIGADKNKGRIAVGYDGDIVLFDDVLNVRMTIVGGQLVYDHSKTLL